MKLNFSTYQIGSVFAFLSAFLFSTKAIFIKQAYALSPALDATTLMVIRMASALPFFLILCWFGRHKYYSVKLKDWLLLIITGSLGYYISSWLDFFGLMFISASLERIILFLYPTLTVIASSIIFKQKLNLKIIFALILIYAVSLSNIIEFKNPKLNIMINDTFTEALDKTYKNKEKTEIYQIPIYFDGWKMQLPFKYVINTSLNKENK